MDDIKAKQQVVERIKESTNILVTVSNDPSVDALSAALALTLLLDKLDKHSTAVFSGAIPSAISFLEPEKTFENTTDSLRDFIIALDKEKADHLRYKVDGDVVKIFITPYKTTITSDDLDFSQGDYNVELVIALGVENQDHLDAALDAHGRILHDATVVSVTRGDQLTQLGSIDWHDQNASSLSEMITGLAEALKKDSKSILEKQTATALLTGIVAATDRFSNPNTTSKVMTVSAQLMAAGADQQLIAAKLQESHEIGSVERPSSPVNDVPLQEDTASKVSKSSPAEEKERPSKDGSITIDHDDDDSHDEESGDDRGDSTPSAPDPASDDDGTKTKSDDDNDDRAVQTDPSSDHVETLAELTDRVKAEERAIEQKAEQAAVTEAKQVADAGVPSSLVNDVHGVDHASGDDEPTFSGTLNATTEQAADDARANADYDHNKTTLSHSYLGAPPENTVPINGAEAGKQDAIPDPFKKSAQPVPSGPVHELVVTPPSAEDVHPAYGVDAGQPVPTAALADPIPEIPLPMPPPVPDFTSNTVPAPATAYAPDPSEPPERLGDIFAPENSYIETPVKPTGPVLPPTNPLVTPAPFESSGLDQPKTAFDPNDPGQFKIPGQ